MFRLPLLAAFAVVVAVLDVPEAAVLGVPEAAVLGVSEAAAQVVCPEPKTQANFDVDSYLGPWHEMKRVRRNFEDDGECGMAHYSWLDASTNASFNVLNTNYVPKSRAVSSVVLRAEPVDIQNGKLKLVFPTLPEVPESKYWVLGTDYDSYAVVYSCADDPAVIVPRINLWVLSRDPSKYTAAVDAEVSDLIESVGLDGSILQTVEHHEGCPEATCMACSSPEESLDLSKLKGRWATVLHSPFATNTHKQRCSLAEFTAISDGVKLNFTTYELTSATTGVDKESQLNAKWTDATKKDGSFEIAAGTPGGKLCLLGTDYDSWAVVSVCLSPTPTTTAAPVGPLATLVPATTGGVFVLSRKRGLTPAQQMEANEAVAKAGIPADSMKTTPPTPCPALALTGDTCSAAP